MKFLLGEERPAPLAIMRVLLGLALFCDAVSHWPYLVELYSLDGLPMPTFIGTGFVPPTPSATVAVLCGSLLVAASIGVMVGWHTRISLLLCLSLSLWLSLLDGAGTLKKFTAISHHSCFLLIFTSCGKVWSIDARLQKIHPESVRSPIWPRRLMQLLVCSVYWQAAITKMRLPDYAAGELLIFSLLDPRWGGGGLGQWFSTFPKLVVFAAYATVLFEIAFPLLIWGQRTRRPMLLVAFGFHLSLTIFLSLELFSLVMWAALMAFVTDDDLRWTQRFTKTLPSRMTTPRQHRRLYDVAGYAMLLAISIPIGFALQPPSIPEDAAWQEMDTKLVAEIMTEPELQPSDYLHSVSVGSRLANFHVFGERDRLRPGMVMYVLMRFSQRHPEYDLLFRLTGPDDAEFEHETTVFADSPRLAMPFQFHKGHQSGNYHLQVFVNHGLLAELPEELLYEHHFELLNEK